MTGKLFGIILVFCGLAGAAALWWFTKSTTRSNAYVAVRRFKLDHEYENKGFTEKGQSEGISDIPNNTKTAEQTDLFQSNSPVEIQKENTPGDNF
ncbi:hypothetical protein DFO55_12479 [Grimontella sp. AG753]|nr:hypothetical protein DFO55_12479 [Grimontella sp. AG753]